MYKTAKSNDVANPRLEEAVFRTSDRISSDLLNSKRKLMSTLTGWVRGYSLDDLSAQMAGIVEKRMSVQKRTVS
jgi:hypothetical protein